MDIFFGLTGPQFLVFYTVVSGAFIFGSWKLTGYLIESTKSAGDASDLDAYEVAYIRSKDRGLLEAVLTKLLAAKFLEASDTELGSVKRGKCYQAKLPHKKNQKASQELAEELDLAVLETLAEDADRVISIKEILRTLSKGEVTIFDKYRQKLLDSGHLVFYPNAVAIFGMNIMFSVAIGGYGLLRLYKGLVREKPILFLLVLFLGVAQGLWKCIRKSMELERADQSIVEQLKESKDRSLVESADPHMVTWAVSLYGAYALVGSTAYSAASAAFKNEWMTAEEMGAPMTFFSDTFFDSSSSFDTSCGSSCGSSCGGGCGGGCGGCGGCGG